MYRLRLLFLPLISCAILACQDDVSSRSEMDCRAREDLCGAGTQCQVDNQDGIWRCRPVADATPQGVKDSNTTRPDQESMDQGRNPPIDGGTSDDGLPDLRDAQSSDVAMQPFDAEQQMDMGSIPDSTVTPDAAIIDAAMDEVGVCPSGFPSGDVRRNIPYGQLDGRQVLDLYLVDSPEPSPVLIWIHGGGWRGGSKDTVNAFFLNFRQRGYAVASIEYRLSDHPWPAPVEDVKSAVRFLRENAARYGLDPNRFAAAGSSAGGHLVGMLGISPDAALFVNPNAPPVTDAVQAVVNFFGPSDLDQMDNDARIDQCPDNSLCHDCEDSPESLLLDCRPSVCPNIADEASPVNYVDGDEAPMLLIHGLTDCTVPTNQSRRLHRALDDAQQTVQLIEVPNVGHSLRGCLNGPNQAQVTEFIEAELRNCRDAPAMPMNDPSINDCLQAGCPELAAACEQVQSCVELETCFQTCYRDQLGNCIRRCLDEVEGSAMGRVTHEPLFRCGEPLGCYTVDN